MRRLLLLCAAALSLGGAMTAAKADDGRMIVTADTPSYAKAFERPYSWYGCHYYNHCNNTVVNNGGNAPPGQNKPKRNR